MIDREALILGVVIVGGGYLLRAALFSPTLPSLMLSFFICAAVGLLALEAMARLRTMRGRSDLPRRRR